MPVLHGGPDLTELGETVDCPSRWQFCSQRATRNPHPVHGLFHEDVHMPSLILASGSEIRAQLLRSAHVAFEVQRPRLDEDALRAAMQAEGITPRDMADHLAESKALKVSSRYREALVLGCDQILDFDGSALAKPDTPAVAREQLRAMSGRQHMLHSAIVLAEAGRPVWRHLSTVRLTMRELSEAYLSQYIDRNWDQIRHCVGGYQLEAEGVRLFSRIDGDYFSVLGLPLLPLLDYLAARGMIET